MPSLRAVAPSATVVGDVAETLTRRPAVTNSEQRHKDQVDYWNGPGGAHWVARHEHMDRMLAQVTDIVLARAGVAPGMTVLDLGCGCGGTTEVLADLVAPVGKVVGLDVSAPMLEVASRRLKERRQVKLICDDAAHHPFAPATMDVIASRFGVMFFGDPVSAFTNFGQSLKLGGRLVFACWRKMDENPWMQVPLAAAAEHVAPFPRHGPDDPGPFAFADPAKVQRIITSAGLKSPRITPRELVLDLSGGFGLEQAVTQSAQLGPISKALEGQPQTVRDAANRSIRETLRPYATPTGVLMKAAIWIVESSR